MRAPLLGSLCLLSLAIAPSASAVSMAWSPVGNPGNACESQPATPNGGPGGCFGAVGYAYAIGTYDVTNAQYVEFLNAKAAADPFGLYHTNMSLSSYGGIARSGASGSYTYSATPGRGNLPVNFVGFFDALRFANWMNNGLGSADTETGSYTLLGGTATPSNANSVGRNDGATIVLPSENEWYKAAFRRTKSATLDSASR
jgi:Sulfatase-modifying factor enzyme 1